MRRIILFRFHRSPIVCRNRLQLLRLFNPGKEIFGLYGGPDRDLVRFQRLLGGCLEDIYPLAGKSPDWKWRNGDLALNSWYRDRGSRLPFEMVHVIEWDMLLLDTLDRLYRGIPSGALGLSGLTELKLVENKWKWASSSPWKEELAELLAFARQKFDYRGEPFSCIAGGACFPRPFLERYSAMDVPLLGNDEVRMPLFAQILGFPLHDTGFFNRMGPEGRELFNFKKSIPTQRIRAELRKRDGRRAFHPYTRILDRLTDSGFLAGFRHQVRNLGKKAYGRLAGQK